MLLKPWMALVCPVVLHVSGTDRDKGLWAVEKLSANCTAIGPFELCVIQVSAAYVTNNCSPALTAVSQTNTWDGL